MSIYPVKLIEWYPPIRRPKQENFHYQAAFRMVKVTPCLFCGKIGKYKNAWAHHSIPWGHGDVFCSKRCLNRKKKK